jgi:hypothetical protein
LGKELKTTQHEQPLEITMSNPYGGLLDRAFIFLFVVLAGVAGLLFIIFNFLGTSQLNEAMGLILFLSITGLLIAGYALGFTVLAFLTIFVLTRFWQRMKLPEK